MANWEQRTNFAWNNQKTTIHDTQLHCTPPQTGLTGGHDARSVRSPRSRAQQQRHLLQAGRRQVRQKPEDGHGRSDCRPQRNIVFGPVEMLLHNRQAQRRQGVGHVLKRHQLHHGRPAAGGKLQERGRLVQPRALYAKELVQRRQAHVHRPGAHRSHRRIRKQPPRQLPLRRDQRRAISVGRRLQQARTLNHERIFGHGVRAGRRV